MTVIHEFTPALTDRQIPEFMRGGAPDGFFADPDIAVNLPQDRLAVYMLAFSIGYRQAILDSGGVDRREMLAELDELLTKHRIAAIPRHDNLL